MLARLDPSLFADADRAGAGQPDPRAGRPRAAESGARRRTHEADASARVVRPSAHPAERARHGGSERAARPTRRSARRRRRSRRPRRRSTRTRSTSQHTVIEAPIDGLVISRNVDVGQTVAASMQAPTLFVLAADLTKMQVVANLDESDVGRIRPGQHVTFRVDAYPADDFIGTVAQVRLQPIVQQNVVTYATVIDVPNPELKLKPGMTANVNVEIARRTDVLRVPNAALRFRPTPRDLRGARASLPRSQVRRGCGRRPRTWSTRCARCAGRTGCAAVLKARRAHRPLAVAQGAPSAAPCSPPLPAKRAAAGEGRGGRPAAAIPAQDGRADAEHDARAARADAGSGCADAAATAAARSDAEATAERRGQGAAHAPPSRLLSADGAAGARRRSTRCSGRCLKSKRAAGSGSTPTSS